MLNLNLTDGDAALKLELLKKLRRLLLRSTKTFEGAFYLCLSLSHIAYTYSGARRTAALRAALDLKAYIAQGLTVGDESPLDVTNRSVEVWLNLQGIVYSDYDSLDRMGNLCRQSWLDRMIEQLQDHLNRKERPAHEVVVGNVGTVYSGSDEQAAKDAYDGWYFASASGAGRAAGEPVTWLKGGEIHKEYNPTTNKENTV